MSLIKYLKIDYNNLYEDPLIKHLKVTKTPKCSEIISSFDKKTYILNWKGNPVNPHEKNRRMELENAIDLFNINDVNFIVITKNITPDEQRILKKYNIKSYGDDIDNDGKAFYDTISILRNVEGVISTDTSLPHLSLSLGVKTFVLLSIGCELRWTTDNKTKWYPDAILLRQQKLGNWKDPIDKLKIML